MKSSIVFLLIAGTVWSQATKIGNCDLATAGGSDAKEFLRFQQELQKAVAGQDAGAMALLVENPLRVNNGRGAYYLKDARSLQSQFQEIFPAAVREVILSARPEALSCTYRGIMYGNGEVWAALTNHGYAIQTVNLPSDDVATASNRPHVEFVCRTDKHRIVIDSTAAGTSRYRAWNQPRSIMDKPDLEISKGSQNLEGSGPCVHSVWLFASGAAKYQVNDIGCYPDSNQPPVGATGQLTVTAGGKTSSAWCY